MKTKPFTRKLGWYLITKSFRGGSQQFAFRITKKIAEKFDAWDNLFEYIGEHTGGGHENGYSISAKYQKHKPNVKETLRFSLVTKEELTIGR